MIRGRFVFLMLDALEGDDSQAGVNAVGVGRWSNAEEICENEIRRKWWRNKNPLSLFEWIYLFIRERPNHMSWSRPSDTHGLAVGMQELCEIMCCYFFGKNDGKKKKNFFIQSEKMIKIGTHSGSFPPVSCDRSGIDQ